MQHDIIQVGPIKVVIEDSYARSFQSWRGVDDFPARHDPAPRYDYALSTQRQLAADAFPGLRW
jgi:hypothetical protein